ncbi:DUF416 family protein [Hymenobacter sp. YC55]|uniref:DUF416 family protein n=1 Tax=Hymenobacter sp. YC55 TaxID=3034019 RepID=UPI0023F8E03B|nr:DUF416 family protein [Hymenobacter sp. YC55]MDF7815221.1 DUF416 family protein [Hymenobacter sp. YC55]
MLGYTIQPPLLSLPLTHQVAFAALTCERMLAAISWFDRFEMLPGTPLFRTAIAALCAFGLNEPIEVDEFARLQQQLEAFWPDLDESTNPAASYAFDACVALSEALALVQDQELEHLVQCATAATDTVDMYVQEVTGVDLPPDELNTFLEASPLMQRELARQDALVQALTTEPELTAAMLDQLRFLNGQEQLVDFSVF